MKQAAWVGECTRWLELPSTSGIEQMGSCGPHMRLEPSPLWQSGVLSTKETARYRSLLVSKIRSAIRTQLATLAWMPLTVLV